MLETSQVDKLRGALVTSGWLEVIKPAIQQRAKAVTGLFRLLPSERPEPYKGLDDTLFINILRGRLEELEWFLAAFENEVRVHDINRRLDELQGPNGQTNSADSLTANP